MPIRSDKPAEQVAQVRLATLSQRLLVCGLLSVLSRCCCTHAGRCIAVHILLLYPK